MTRDTFLGRMDDDSPRGFIPTRPTQTPASNSEARKRAERQAHPDPAVRDLIADAWDAGCRAGTSRAMRRMSDEPSLPLAGPADNPYRDQS